MLGSGNMQWSAKRGECGKSRTMNVLSGWINKSCANKEIFERSRMRVNRGVLQKNVERNVRACMDRAEWSAYNASYPYAYKC